MPYPNVVESALERGFVAMTVEEPDAVMAEPMEAVAVILAESVEPKEAGFGGFAGFVAPMVAGDESLLEVVVPTRPGTPVASVLGADPMLAAFAAGVVLESSSRVAELVFETVIVVDLVAVSMRVDHMSEFVPALDSRKSEPEVTKCLSGAEAELGSAEVDVSPMLAVVETDLEARLEAALELTGKKLWTAAVVFVVVLQPR